MSSHVLLRRVPLILTLAAVVWCVWIGFMIWSWNTHRGTSPLTLILIAFSPPLLLACGAALSARYHAPDFMAVATVLFLGFSFVTGFSIGGAYHGPALLLGIATLLETVLFFRERRRVAAEL